MRPYLPEVIKHVARFLNAVLTARQGNTVPTATHHLKRSDAEKSVTPDALSSLYTLQQEIVSPIFPSLPIRPALSMGAGFTLGRWGKPKKGGNGAQQICHDDFVDRDHVALAGEAGELSEAGIDGHKSMVLRQ